MAAELRRIVICKIVKNCKSMKMFKFLEQTWVQAADGHRHRWIRPQPGCGRLLRGEGDVKYHHVCARHGVIP